MQAADTATDRDFARKAATAARWAGKTLWIVIGSLARAGYALLVGVVTFIIAFNETEKQDVPSVSLFGIGPGPAPGEPGHNHTRWMDYHLGEDDAA